jgi:hypothetical protein
MKSGQGEFSYFSLDLELKFHLNHKEYIFPNLYIG